jgi:hypothetical protein
MIGSHQTLRTAEVPLQMRTSKGIVAVESADAKCTLCRETGFLPALSEMTNLDEMLYTTALLRMEPTQDDAPALWFPSR